MDKEIVKIRLRIPGRFATARSIWQIAERMCAKTYDDPDAVNAVKQALFALTCENCDGIGLTGTNKRTCPDCKGTGWKESVSPILQQPYEALRENPEISEGARWADASTPACYYRVHDAHIELCNKYDNRWVRVAHALLGIDFASDDDASWVLDYYAKERQWQRIEN